MSVQLGMPTAINKITSDNFYKSLIGYRKFQCSSVSGKGNKCPTDLTSGNNIIVGVHNVITLQHTIILGRFADFGYRCSNHKTISEVSCPYSDHHSVDSCCSDGFKTVVGPKRAFIGCSQQIWEPAEIRRLWRE